MCEPSSWVMAGVAIVGALTTAKAQHDQGKFEEKVAQRNADLDAADEADAVRRGAIAEEQHRARIRALLGSQRAAFGANNVVSATGTPLGLLTETAQLGEEDAITIRNNAAREAWGYRVSAEDSKMRGRQARRAGSHNAGATVLGGAADAYGSWSQWGGGLRRKGRASRPTRGSTLLGSSTDYSSRGVTSASGRYGS